MTTHTRNRLIHSLFLSPIPLPLNLRSSLPTHHVPSSPPLPFPPLLHRFPSLLPSYPVLRLPSSPAPVAAFLARAEQHGSTRSRRSGGAWGWLRKVGKAARRGAVRPPSPPHPLPRRPSPTRSPLPFRALPSTHPFHCGMWVCGNGVQPEGL